MDDPSSKPVTEQSNEPTPVVVNPLQSLPEDISPEDYLVKSRNLLDMNRPESITNNFLLFSPLLPVLVFTFISLLVIGFYVNQRQQQVADIRNRAQSTPCASGSNPLCRNPGDSCGENKICINGKNAQNPYVCECQQGSPIPTVSVIPSQPETPLLGINTLHGIFISAGIVFALIIVIFLRRKQASRR